VNENELGQPIGFSVEHWQPRPRPPRSPASGRLCRVEPFDPASHSRALYAAFARDVDRRNWTYLPYGPFDSFDAFDAWALTSCAGDDPLFHTVVDRSTGAAVGLASYLRIRPNEGVIEVGHIHFSPALQRTTLSTEAMFLMMRRVFDELGYRRYEWKCDALNEPSRKAALRLGFRFEGIFRQATIYKNRNRDTAWYSIIDSEWPGIRAAYEGWLDADNFDAEGRQRRSLSSVMPPAG
jgi:RimJ/RimL family protein N-acetyltransferase